MEKRLIDFVEQIKGLDEETMRLAADRQAFLAKPPGSLGKLEDMSIKLSGITGNIKNDVKKQAIVIMSSDNGVVEEGVASAPQTVTLNQTINFTRGLTGVSSMAKYFGIDLLVVDMGVNNTIPKSLLTETMIEEDALTKKIVNRRIANGTKNLAKEPAMTREEAITAILTGIESVKAIKESGHQIFGVGEMGIGNTTTSSALLSAITGAKAIDTVGRGGGLNDEGLKKKLSIVENAVKDLEGKDIIDKLAKVSGFDICAMVGAFLGSGVYRIPVVIDGFISIIAACAAKEICPSITDFMFASHKSFEKGYVIAMERLGLSPMFDLGMRLGEGSGCPIAFKTIEAACGSMNLMATLEEAAIQADYLIEIREGNLF